MKATRFLVSVLALGCMQLLAMPNFARKYGVDCATCHTTIPVLNEMGYNFRKAGFRMPSEIYRMNGTKTSSDKPVQSTLENTTSARIQLRYDNTSHDDGVKTTSNSQLTAHEITFYPLTGSYGKYMGSLMEATFVNGGTLELENAYMRFAAGQENSFFSGRVGVFHPFEGFGASDRPMSLDRPLFQGTTAKGAYFKPWGYDEAGLELAYVYNRSTFSATLFNGLKVDAAGNAAAAQGGKQQRDVTLPDHSGKDFQLFFNQILGENGTGVSAYYYSGSLYQPVGGVLSPTVGYANDYTRTAIYASYVPMPKLQLKAGYQIGTDHAAPGGAFDTYQSKGYFAEIDSALTNFVTIGGRLDQFDPSDKIDHNDKKGFTAFLNMPFQDGFQLIAQYASITSDQPGGLPSIKDNNFQIRFVWIF
jgi:hypothetical protein